MQYLLQLSSFLYPILTFDLFIFHYYVLFSIYFKLKLNRFIQKYVHQWWYYDCVFCNIQSRSQKNKSKLKFLSFIIRATTVLQYFKLGKFWSINKSKQKYLPFAFTYVLEVGISSEPNFTFSITSFQINKKLFLLKWKFSTDD